MFFLAHENLKFGEHDFAPHDTLINKPKNSNPKS